MRTLRFAPPSRCSRLKRLGLALSISAFIFLNARPASALSITLNFIGGTAPANAVGGGNLIDIFTSAANVWSAAILDPWVVNLQFGWAPQAGGVLAAHQLLAQLGHPGVPTRETAGAILFDNDGSFGWFLDQTPGSDEEWTTYTETTANFGGGVINSGRVLTGPTGFAVGQPDLFSVALHEIGHSVGLSGALLSFQLENGDLDVDVAAPRPFAGSVLPTISGAHLSIVNSLMFPFTPLGVRTLPAGVDVLANAELSDWGSINLHPRVASPIPEPTTMTLMLLGAGIGAARRIRYRGRKQ